MGGGHAVHKTFAARRVTRRRQELARHFKTPIKRAVSALVGPQSRHIFAQTMFGVWVLVESAWIV